MWHVEMISHSRRSYLTITSLLSSTLANIQLSKPTTAFLPNPTFRPRPRILSTHQLAMSTSTTKVPPPVATRNETQVVYAGINHPTQNPPLTRQTSTSPHPLLSPPVPVSDPYGWLRDESRSDPLVIKHLDDENAYTASVTDHLGELRGTLYEEMVGSVLETDYTLPRERGDWWYYTRTVAGKSYTRYCRAPKEKGGVLTVDWDGSAEAVVLEGEVCYLDVNELAEGRDYCAVGRVKTSPSHSLLAYSADYVGRETCQLFVTNVETGEVVDHDSELEMDGQVVWGNDDDTLFYVTLDETLRGYRVYRREIGISEEDELLFEEKDELLRVVIYKSLDKKYLFVRTSSKETSEIHYLDLADPTASLQCIAPRREKVLYGAEHRHSNWLISTNQGGTPNLRLVTAPARPDCAAHWTDVTLPDSSAPLFAGTAERSLSGITPFENHVVAEGREEGIPRVWIISYDGATAEEFTRLSFDETAYDVGLSSHFEFDADTAVVAYDSLVTPLSHIAVDMNAPEKRTVLKEKVVPGYEKSEYGCERVFVPARDGTPVPVSLVYRRDVLAKHESSGEALAVHLYGYGSYGACMEASFRASRLALLDRGMVYAIAHVRGGGEMGRQWYEEPNGAKYLCKKNTFWDFVDVGKWLLEERKLTARDKLSCEGRSAGGLLIGAAINLEPGMFKAAILGVPFVDVVCTMIDATIPLTIAEWVEWGNPNEERYHQYMMEYSPINNVQKDAAYPACLLTGGLHDPRVQYWEPAKFAAELRHKALPTSGPICLKTDMAAGHFSASDRYKYLKELAFDYAFLLDQLGLAEEKSS